MTSDLAVRAGYWRATVLRGGCVMCRHFPLAPAERVLRAAELARLAAHHICPKEDLKRWGWREDWRVLYHEANGLALCELHHHRHEWRIEPVPRRLLPPGVFEFAAALDDELDGLEIFRALLDRDYP